MAKGRTLLALGLLCGLARPAFAQSAEDKGQAREFANAGLDALEHHDWAKAEDQFRRADALYHAATISVGLARAQAQLGKVVEAWENYHRVIVDGAPPGANAVILKAVEDAKNEITSVEGRRGSVTINVAGCDNPTVTVDGAVLSAAAVGAARPANPGSHPLRVTADGCLPVDTTFTVTEGQAINVPVKLEHGVSPALPPPGTDANASHAPDGESGPASTGGRNYTLAFVALGVGAAGLLTGAITGGLALGKHGDLKNSPCAGGTCPASQVSAFNSELSSYHTLSTVSTIGFIVGGVGAAAGAVFLITGVGGGTRTGSRVVPYVGLGSVGAVGRF